MSDEILSVSIHTTQVSRLVLEAEARIRPSVIETPLELSAVLSDMYECDAFLKCEHLQHTGSFKLRGAISKLTHLMKECSNGNLQVIAASTGNHGLAVAYAAEKLGIGATIYLPENTSDVKQNAIKRLGANLVTVSGDGLKTELEARSISNKTGTPFVSPYNDIQVIAGQGTIGLELQKFSDLDAVFVSVGGGGLISGVGSYLKSVNSAIRIIGCWPQNAPAMLRCLLAGKIIDVSESPTLSTSTAGGVETDSITFPLCQQVIDECVSVSEEEIADAMRLVAEHEHYLIEGAAGVAVAAFMRLAPQMRGKKIAILLCGRNLSMKQMQEALL